MKADRSLVGVIGIALVVSTTVTLFIIGEGGGPYSVVKSEYGPSGKGRWLVGVNLLAKETIGSLRLSHFAVMRRDDLIADVDRNGTPEEVCQRIPSLQAYLDIASAVGIEPVVRQLKVKIPRWEDEKTLLREEHDLYLYDFSDLVWQAVPDEIMYSLERPRFRYGHLWDYYNAFACAFDENDDLAHFYEGVADFYLNKVIIIDELTLQMNEEKSVYYGVTKEDKSEEDLSVLNAPERGFVTFEDLRRDDMMSVVYAMDTSKRPLNQGGLSQVPMRDIVYIVEIIADAESPEYIVKTLDPPPPEPEK